MSEPKHIVFVRVPMPRGDFVDPPLVEWDLSKDKALWAILSGAVQKEVDWNQLADHFDVPVDFLLQQVAFVTERHASQVRAQVRKATAAAKGVPSAPSPVDTGHQRTQSTQSQSLRRDSPLPRNEGSGTGTPTQAHRPSISRNTSTNTTILREAAGSSSRPGTAVKGGEQNSRRRLSSLPVTLQPRNQPPSPQLPADIEEDRLTEKVPSPDPENSSETSSSSSDDESSPAQSRIIRRPPRFQHTEANNPGHDDDDEEDSEPAFQPFKDTNRSLDMASTLKGDGKSSSGRHSRRAHKPGKDRVYLSQTSDDSAGSGAMISRPGTTSRQPKPVGPLSPKRTAELAGRSSSRHSKSHSSDGTPDMGSSFSDLDDASVTQSALEEALASHMNGAGSSRFSISQAFRSRHAPSSGYK